MRRTSLLLALTLALPALRAAAQQAPPEQASAQTRPISEDDRSRLHQMLDQINGIVKRDYYDPTYHGVDLKQRYKTYEARLNEAPTLGAANRVMAAFLAGLHDSHTYYLPPQFNYDFFYGFTMQMIGGRCFITAVRPGSTADGLVRPGDEVVSIEGYSVNQKDFRDLSYDLYTLEPRGGLHLELRDPTGAVRTALVMTKFVKRSGVDPGWTVQKKMEQPMESRLQLVGDVMVWKFPGFRPDNVAAKYWKQAAPHSALVIDLRGDPGGDTITLQKFLGNFLPKDTLIGTVDGRDHHDTMKAASSKPEYQGKVIVLVDSESASAAEIFARALQLHHRATIVGARSAGAVMEAEIRVVPAAFGGACGVAVTIADLHLTDGQSLENVGVTPDVVVEPTAADLAAGRDPALAEAVKLAGGSLDPTAAGRLFPYLWLPYKMSN